MARVAVNGLGRIGRAMLKIVVDTPGVDLVAANDIAPPDSVAYLLNTIVDGDLVKVRRWYDVGLLESGSPEGAAYLRTDGMTQEQANDHRGHEGRLWVSPNLPQGSIFQFTLRGTDSASAGA